MRNPGIAAFLADADEFVVTEAARAINDDLSIPEALPALGEVVGNTRFTNEALLRRAINANLRVGTEKAMQNLVAYAQREDSPAKMRAEAVEALSTWAKPSVVDRVDGRYRGVVTRDPQPLKKEAAPVLAKLIGHQDQLLRLGAIKAVGKLDVAGNSDALFTRLKEDKQAEVRVAALRALAATEDKQIGKAIEAALADPEKSVRVAGLDLLPKMDLSKDLMVSLLSEVINTKTPEEKQAALVTLGTLPVQHSQKVFDGLLTQLAAGKLPVEVHLDLEEAIDSTRSPQLMARYKDVSAKIYANNPDAAFQGSLFGGDEDRGRRIFFNHQNAQCIRCHSYDDLGGNAGPRLNGVANRLSRPQLLEALINPSARLAPGFGAVTLQLKNGKTVSGILQEETGTQLVLKGADEAGTVILKEQIRQRTNAPSSMPEMKYLLTKREVRDVVSFLATLKEEH
jgi:putative heme-binding domain-containing protein